MSQLERALRRLDGAVTRLEAAIGNGATPASAAGSVTEDVEALGAERDRLAGEVARLHARAADDAQLRADAARAVRSALHDLRGAVGQGSNGRDSNGHGSNAQGSAPDDGQADVPASRQGDG